jgi:hypothetical protein
MKKIMFLLVSLIAIAAFSVIAQRAVEVAPTIRIEPVAPLTQPIQIEVGKDIAKSVEIKQVAGNEIKIRDLPSAAVVVTPTPEARVHTSHAHPHEETPSPSPPVKSNP